MVDCSDLVFSQVVTSQEYDGYIDLIRERTAFNETILSECHAAICGALWGYGNTDLAGIGVAVGYCLTTLLSPLLSLANLFSATPRPLLVAALSTYFECAAYFAIAIQLASTVTLASKDYYARNGRFDQEIAGIVCLVSMLPLLGPVSVLPFCQRTDRRGQRLILYVCVVLLSIYPFGRYFLPDHGPMTQQAALALQNLCHDEATAMLTVEYMIARLSRFIVEGWVLVFIAVARRVCYAKSASFREGRVGVGARVLCCLVILMAACFGVLLVFVFWRLRGAQSALAGEVGGEYHVLDEWGYGQVIAITVFAPVGVEMLFGWWFDEKKGVEVLEGAV